MSNVKLFLRLNMYKLVKIKLVLFIYYSTRISVLNGTVRLLYFTFLHREFTYLSKLPVSYTHLDVYKRQE